VKTVASQAGAKQRIVRIAGAALLALALCGAALDASAQPGRDGGRGNRDDGARQLQRERAEAMEQRRQQMMRERGEMRRGMHELSPEERQQLRRDIRDHGRDVYGDRDRRRGGPPR